MTTLLGALFLVGAIVVPLTWADSYPVRPLSASMMIGGAGVLGLGICGSRFLPLGTRIREFTFIGSGMIGMASLVIGALTLIETYRLAGS